MTQMLTRIWDKENTHCLLVGVQTCSYYGSHCTETLEKYVNISTTEFNYTMLETYSNCTIYGNSLHVLQLMSGFHTIVILFNF